MLFLARMIGRPIDENSRMHKYHLYFVENLSDVETMQLALTLGDDSYKVLRQLIYHALRSVREKNVAAVDEHIEGMTMGICSKLIQGIDPISNIVLDALFYFIIQPQRKPKPFSPFTF
ncbi:unnamed protein product [Gongylonema pulchrum]|uniref:Uncharacterized protein n=1 Tax=Gongylonema pulchrum TaxID=637853 RepID=A0A3P7P432_9BILA|nr:unnamed protein product [Gongylonema pulchrum]